MYIEGESHRRLRGHSHIGPAKQRGVAMIFTAFIIIALVTALGLAIDVGRLYAAQQNLQTAANIAAIEAARRVSGCDTGVPGNAMAAAVAAVNTSVARNFSDRADADLPTAVVNLGAAQPNAVNPDLRVFQTNSELPPPAPSAPGEPISQPVTDSAVQVVLTDPEPPNLFPIFSPANLVATAAAQNTPRASFSVGSSLLNLSPQFLQPLGIDAGVFDQGALANTAVSLGELAAELGVATPQELLSTSLPLQTLIDAIDTVSGGALGGLSQALTSNVGDTAVTLGDVLAASGPVGQSTQAIAAPLADALLQAALANRQEAINLPINGINIGGLAGTTAQLRILEPPQLALDVRPGLQSSQASSGQLLLQLGINIDLGVPPVTAVTGDLPIFIRAGTANAQLQDLFCANSTQPFHEVAIAAQTDTASLGIGRFDDLSAPNPIAQEGGTLQVGTEVTIPGLGTIPITLALGVETGTIPVGNAQANPLMPLFRDPALTPDEQTRQLSGGLRPSDALGKLADELELTLNGGSAGLLNTLSPVLATLLNMLALDDTLGDLLIGLGIDFGNAEITLLGTNINQPEIFQSLAGPPPAVPDPDASDSGAG